ncbi:hypothetical protein I204_06931 [Kwoniella mangroviensis CBS 8886]|nr:hypothetical protein I204_06931 [Kwoniella mangroviensis CBS 8886]
MFFNAPLTTVLLALVSVTDFTTAKPAPRCSTNAECIQRGLPIRSPSKRAFHNSNLRARQAPSDALSFDYTGAVATYTIESAGDYLFTVQAGSGGTTNAGDYTSIGGSAAQVNATIFLNANTVLNLVVGAQAGTASSGFGAGGGGGSFVYTTDNDLLIAAGGGGGGETNYPDTHPGADANSDFSTSASAGSTGVAGGTGGNGGSALTEYGAGGGGAGWLSSGSTPGTSSSGTGGSTKPSWTGGTTTTGASTAGGFGGGGGGGSNGGGGGGGYSGGGGGGQYYAPGSGGGGANYVTAAGTDSSVTIGHTGNGVIIITQLTEAP